MEESPKTEVPVINKFNEYKGTPERRQNKLPPLPKLKRQNAMHENFDLDNIHEERKDFHDQHQGRCTELWKIYDDCCELQPNNRDPRECKKRWEEYKECVNNQLLQVPNSNMSMSASSRINLKPAKGILKHREQVNNEHHKNSSPNRDSSFDGVNEKR